MKKIFLLLIFAGLIIASYYFIFSKEEWSDENLTLIGEKSPSQKYLENLKDSEISKNVFYIDTDRILKAEFGGKVFCVYKIFGHEIDNEKMNLNIYTQVFCEEYYLKNDEVTLGGGVSSPAKITFTVRNEELELQSIYFPKNGQEYLGSLKEIFPEKYYNLVIVFADISSLSPQPSLQAENYFKGKLEVYF